MTITCRTTVSPAHRTTDPPPAYCTTDTPPAHGTTDTPPAYCTIDTPFGRLLLVGRDGALTGLHLADHDRAPRPLPGWRLDPAPFAAARRQLDQYFAGRRTTFDLPLRPEGTPFQVAVWSALAGIPYARTIGYGELARRMGRPGAARAVGAANGRNPIPVILPCHRVIGSDGSLTGYGWGTDRKAWLLEHERAHLGDAGAGPPAPAAAPR